MYGRLSNEEREATEKTFNELAGACLKFKHKATVSKLLDLVIIRANLTSQQELSEALGVGQPYLSLIRHNKVGISKNMAKKLEKLSGIPAPVFLYVPAFEQFSKNLLE